MSDPQDPQPLEDDFQQSSWWDDDGPGAPREPQDRGTHDPPPQAVARFVEFIRDHPEWPADEPGFVAVWWLYTVFAEAVDR